MGDLGGEFLKDLDNGVYDDCPFIDPACFGRPTFFIPHYERGIAKPEGHKKEFSIKKFPSKFEQELHYEITLEREELQELANYKKDKPRYSQYKVELFPDTKQIQTMRMIAGCCRFVWNRGVFLEKMEYYATGEIFGYEVLTKKIFALMKDKETWFLIKAPVQSLCQSLMELDMECKNFLANKTTFPKLKKKKMCESFSYVQGVKIETHSSRFYFPSLGWINCEDVTKIKEKIKIVTIFWYEGKWYGRIITESSPPSEEKIKLD